ncbi:MAG: DUF2877 domain-containing protein [Chloroflexi bacterium]|nr:MAG: DUF2877 domain-containing protein [Chloroflexota bacterium]
MMIFKANTIGPTAYNITRNSVKLSILGMTSRGVFLQNPSGQIVFLSSESYRGPMTINIDTSFTSSRLTPDEKGVILEGDLLSLPLSRVNVSLHGANIWHSPSRPEGYLSRSEMHNYANKVYAKLHSLDLVIGKDHWTKIELDFSTAHLPESLSLLESLLGSGPGLTPFGDDLVAGFLLTLNRWGDIIHPGLEVEAVNDHLVSAARKKTTSLSANLIECAAAGQADERLILALDDLISRNRDPNTCAGYFQSYGSSSGFASFLGMRLGLLG